MVDEQQGSLLVLLLVSAAFAGLTPIMADLGSTEAVAALPWVLGIPAAILVVFVAGVWVLYRVIRGWIALVDRKPMPVPAS